MAKLIEKGWGLKVRTENGRERLLHGFFDTRQAAKRRSIRLTGWVSDIWVSDRCPEITVVRVCRVLTEVPAKKRKRPVKRKEGDATNQKGIGPPVRPKRGKAKDARIAFTRVLRLTEGLR